MGRRASIAANPVLIGAATTLVVIVAVFLAYNANNGLPFVPSYQLNVQVPSAADLVPGNEVRVGGTRVGVIDDIDVKQRANGTNYAVLHTKLDTSIKPLPKDSTVLIRPRSALGLKYLSIVKGTSAQGYPDGGTVPEKQATPIPVEFDEFVNMFNAPTRVASRVNLYEFGNGFAGRGTDLNQAIQDLPDLLQVLTPVARSLARPSTHLDTLFRSLGQTAAEVAPVAEQQASLFVHLDTTFGAIASVARPYLQDAISAGPPAQEAAIKTFPFQQVFLANSASLFQELRPGVQALAEAAPDLSDVVTIGTPVLKESPQFNAELSKTFTSVQTFAEDPLTSLGIADLNGALTSLNPTLSFFTPSQTVCLYPSLLLRNAASLLSDGDTIGNAQRFSPIATPAWTVNNTAPGAPGPADYKNAEGLPSSGPANGPANDNFLHTNIYPNTAAPGQTRECEAGRETFTAGQQSIGNLPGNQGINSPSLLKGN
jgi:ABC-type transporter Mla subunit MlaD